MEMDFDLGGPAEATDPSDLATDSKVQLILAGEQLFAERGTDGASLREIATVAGHGNNNAVRYHFGSKDGLIQAIFRYRVAWLEPARHRLLSKVEEHNLTGDVRSLLEVLNLPYLTMRDARGRFAYPAFLQQYLLRHRPKGMTHAGDDARAISPSLHRVMELLRQRLFYLPAHTVEQRILVSTSIFLSVLLYSENLARPLQGEAFRANISDTLDQMVAAIVAPTNRRVEFLDDAFVE
jgi:AcrR family transcriptional regulator